MADTFRFRNLDGSGPAPFSRALRWMVLDRLTGRRRRSPARAQVPEVAPDVEALRKPGCEDPGIPLQQSPQAVVLAVIPLP